MILSPVAVIRSPAGVMVVVQGGAVADGAALDEATVQARCRSTTTLSGSSAGVPTRSHRYP